jgi:RNA polymerase sigma-70 factor (ECF subfamily)
MTAQCSMSYGKKLIGRPTSSAALAQEYDFVAAAKRGDPRAFEALCKQSADRLFNMARRMMRTREDAEDVVQESFQRAFIHLESFKGDSRFSTWLCRIAMNAALMRLRKKHSRSELSRDECPDSEERFPPFAIKDHKLNPEQIYSEKERQQMLRRNCRAERMMPGGY